ncbi:alpha/beta hydrolase family protein [Bdellovibrio sp. HCB2-146]|uniref:alpha/beta hydrolase family protein n=1 Tax=Bdellovibrio sp. HCB2-146 TaxID=3394362 RepID=UPI0039BCA0FF
MSTALHSTYQKPEKMIDDLIRAGGFPQPVFNWQKTALIKAYIQQMPSIEYVARPQIKVGGVRFSPKNYTAISNLYINRLVYFDIKTGKEKNIPFPKGSIIREVSWAPNGKQVLISLEQQTEQELWLVQIPSLKKERIPKLALNGVLQRIVEWMNEDELLIGARTEKQKGALSVDSSAPQGPIIQQSLGVVSQNRTFADLIRTPHDEKLFAAAIETQLYIYNTKKKKAEKVGKPSLLHRVDLSPNGKYLLVETLVRPFSTVVPFSMFARKMELWTLDGKVAHKLSERGAAEHLPIQGVVTGPRSYQWVKTEPQTLMYVEALDKGDWAVKVDFRDEIFLLPIPSKGKPKPHSILKTKNRYAGTAFFDDDSLMLIHDYERDRQWLTTLLVDRANGYKTREMFSLSTEDDYNNPGEPLSKRNKNGDRVIAIERVGSEKFIYLSGSGASPEGDRPFLRKMNLGTFEVQEIFRSSADSYERCVGLADEEFKSFITAYESQTESPRFFIRDLKKPSHKKLLFADPNPYEILGKIKKEVITYKRDDGVLLSGVLYYPLNYKKGKKYPAIVHAYPLEYTDASTAGQVRGSQHHFSTPYKEDIVYNALRGYVVLSNAQMPIIGHPETKNDTFIEQLVAGAKAAVDTLDARGLIDRNKVGVIGHSYGAFMVSHLLTHSDLFATGIAKSGAYNRSLTPFGFQGERRPFWKAKDTYMRMSPFMDVDKMKKPILLMHGMADNNAGTLTMQTERYFDALKGQGANARLVMLPEESHGYSSIESIAHVLHEIFSWFDAHLK